MSRAADVAGGLGGAKKVGKQWLARCPCHEDGTPSLSLSDSEDGMLLWYCYGGRDGRNIGRELRRRGLLPESRETASADRRQRERPPQPALDRDKLRWLLSKVKPIEGTPAEVYLRSRGLDLPPPGHHLRYLPARPPKYPWPSLIGVVTSFADAKHVMTVHFTRLKNDGSGKAPLDKHAQRSFLAGFAKQGGVIRLCDDAAIVLRLCLAEGIETSLAVTTAYRRDENRYEPVWCALDAGNLARLPVVPGIETLGIYADRGAAGEQAADRLSQRWLKARREVFISTAPVDDWNPTVAT